MHRHEVLDRPTNHYSGTPRQSIVQLGDAIDRRHRGRDRPTGWHEGSIDNDVNHQHSRSRQRHSPMLRSSRSRTTKRTVLTDQHIAESLSRAYVRAIAPSASMRLAIENWSDRALS
jgi:5-methylcytosine-specific restriction endonuclease McrA